MPVGNLFKYIHAEPFTEFDHTLLVTGRTEMAALAGKCQKVFVTGSSGPGTFLGKMTTGIAIFFMLTSLGLSYMSAQKGSTLMKGAGRTPALPLAPEVQKSAALPVTPGPQPAAKPAGAAPKKRRGLPLTLDFFRSFLSPDSQSSF